MQMTLLFPLFAAGLLAQIATPPQSSAPPPAVTGSTGMNRPQPGTPVPPTSPDTVVARVNGKPMTAADADKLLSELPMQIQGAITRNPEQFLQQLLMFEEMAKRAEQEGLDKQSPYRQELDFARLRTLDQAEIDKIRNGVKVTTEEEQKYYNDNKEKMFRKVKAQVILVNFKAPPPATPVAGAPKPPPPAANDGVTRSEVEAKAKVDDLRKQILAGADFGKLAKENSDDKVSAAKDGDYGEITHTSPYPEPIKQAIFNLKPGDVSDPIRQPSGFYLVKAADSSYQPLDQVRFQIHTQLVQEGFKKQMDAITEQFKVTVEDRQYFTTRPPK
jgi:parvulin-like peptidyl-prolyl isomerase